MYFLQSVILKMREYHLGLRYWTLVQSMCNNNDFEKRITAILSTAVELSNAEELHIAGIKLTKENIEFYAVAEDKELALHILKSTKEFK